MIMLEQEQIKYSRVIMQVQMQKRDNMTIKEIAQKASCDSTEIVRTWLRSQEQYNGENNYSEKTLNDFQAYCDKHSLA